MTYVTSLGITRMCEQESVDVYRSLTGGLPTIVASGRDMSHVMPIEQGSFDTEIDYANFKTFEIKQVFTLYSGVLPGDELHIGSDIWDVRVVNKWETPDFYHLIVEETR